MVANGRLIPTHTAADLKHGITPADVVSIRGKRLEVVVGLWTNGITFQNAQEQKDHPERLRIPNIPGMSAIRVRWLVRGDGPYTVAVESIKGGRDRQTVSE